MNLENIKGVGKETAKYLNNLDIYNINDLINYYPYKYNFIKFTNLDNTIQINGYIEAKIITEPKVFFIKRGFNKLSFTASCDNKIFNVIIFNRAFLKNNLCQNQIIILYGKYDKLKNIFTASDIKFNLPNNSIESIYHLNTNIKRNSFIKILSNTLNAKEKFDDYIPEYINQKYNFVNKEDALKYIHFPKNIDEIKQAKLKLIYEELFVFMFKVNYLKYVNKELNGIERIINENDINNFYNLLNFNLTNDQKKAIDEIKNDMISKKKMNRLVLGDVGSGKTIVACFAMYINFLSNHQTVFMAPTEILAEQHYKSISKLFKKTNIKIELLTGKQTKKEKEQIKARLKKQEIDVIIGTHAVITDNVEFNNLGLVITDEQHRFGVKQRNDLEKKGKNPDILYLSATPIPRSYALVIYGDTDVSIIKTKPNGRKEITTKILAEEEIKECLKVIYEQLKSGHQAFVVCPLIEDSESDLNSVLKIKENFEKAFKDTAKIEIIHGKLKSKEKDEIMSKFEKQEIDILISTTVIEVGIDIPNATVITIYNAERFGLATLHQLRGRVGRNDKESYCFLIGNKNNKRLKVMEESNDGFYITEKDFEQRKEGDIFGTQQSGDMSFLIANIKNDYEIMLRCNKDSEEFIKSKKYLNNILYEEIINKLNNLN